MRYALATLTIALVLGGGLLLVALHPGPARSDPSPGPAASPSSEPTATPSPAPAAVVRLALAQRQRALRAWHRWQQAKHCFDERPGRRVAGRPSRAEPAAVWLDHMERWQRQVRDFKSRTARLVQRMKHPGGPSSGIRWMPLARWVGWPRSALPQLAAIIYRESSGRERAYNPSGASGLLQFMPGWYRGWWGLPAFDPFDAEQNLRAGLHVWRDQGHSFLPAWALTA